jgi:hypothetical protein
MAAFAELRPQIGIAPSCVALSINRAEIYRTRDRLHPTATCHIEHPAWDLNARRLERRPLQHA